MAKGLPTTSYTEKYPEAILISTNVDGWFFDGYLDVSHTTKLTITEHAIQQGAAISDHAYEEPVQLSMDIIMSDAMGDYKYAEQNRMFSALGAKDSRSIGAYNILRELQRQRKVFSVGTRLATYENMMLETLSITDDNTTINGLKASLTFKQIIVANEEVVKVSTRGQTTDSSSVKPEIKDATSPSVDFTEEEELFTTLPRKYYNY